MKQNKLKKGLFTLALVVAIISFSGIVNAAGSWYSYSATVPVFSDYETSTRTKASSDAAGRVQVYSNSGSLVAWIESNSGTNITNKVSYSVAGYSFELNYSSPSTYVSKPVKLNISTSTFQLTPVTTSGIWSPDRAS